MTTAAGAGRVQAQPAAAVTAAASASAPRATHFHVVDAALDGEAAARTLAVTGVTTPDCPRPASASANSAAVANRSAGSFSSAVSTAASTCAGMVWRWAWSGRGDSVTTRATIACAVEPVNGGSPVSASYSTAPSA